MKKWHLVFFLFTSLMFSGCSIQQYFILANSTDDFIVVNYSLSDPNNENALFGKAGEVYQSNRDYHPNWEHKIPFKDLNTSTDKVQLKLGPKSTLVFGVLSNDTYDVNTKKSAGGKLFNLKTMNFTVNGIEFLIDEDNFHDFFIEDDGVFKYIIQ